MRNESRRGTALFVALLLAAAASGVMAEDGATGGEATTDKGGGVDSAFPALSSTLPAEAPTSIFNAKLGTGPDADAEFLVNGSWSSTVTGTLDLQKAPGSSFALASTQPLLFTQDPDMALSFLLYKKIFVEAKVSQDVSQAKYAAGYRGSEDEFVKEVRIGNDGINFPELPFLTFGEGSYRSFGASALVGTDTFAGKAMVRYDQASRVTKHFVGSTEITETEISANAFISGKYFMTANAPNAAVAVYVQSVSGTLSGSDGDRYRRMDTTEFSYSAVTGVVSLSSAASTRVLAQYPGCGSDVTLPGVGGCDLLYDPPSSEHSVATIDPKLQVLCRYATTATPSTGEAFVRNKASGLRDTTYEAVIDTNGYIEVTRPGLDASGARASSKGANAYRQPFGSTSSADMEYIYTTDFACATQTIGVAPVYTRSVVVRTFASASQITIDKDVVAGSVEVTRNGVPDYAFTVDPDSGVVTLASPPAAAEEIDISYLKESDERKTGIVMGALGGFWDLGSGRSAWAALGASWAVPGSSYSSGADSSPGSANLTAGWRKTEGALKSDSAIAFRYSEDDSTGIYRIEGMESTTDYSTSFRQLTDSTAYTDTEIAENSLESNFPSTVDSFHKDGSTQKALEIYALEALNASSPASLYKVEDAPTYGSYKTFAFFAKLPPDAALTLKLDDGSVDEPSDLTGASVGVILPADGARKNSWGRYLLHYGKGNATVYRQENENASEVMVSGASSSSPSVTSTGSRLVIYVTGLSAGEEAWIDEVVLEDSVGQAAFLFQSKAAYDDPKLTVGGRDSTLVSNIKADGYAQGSLDTDPYVAGGSSVAADVGFVGLGLHARSSVSDGATAFSGGHSIELPSRSFPLMLKDEFDYNPGSGAFGRSDSVTLSGGPVASASAKQSCDWTPDSSTTDSGVLVQTWSNSLVLGPSWLTLGLDAKNRALPSESPSSASAGMGYFPAWISAFGYISPAFESSSDLREAKGSLSVKSGQSEYLSASFGETTTPDGDSGTRLDSATARIAFPFTAFGLGLEPFYSRTWTEQRDEAESSLVGDAGAAIGDAAQTTLLYRSPPFVELFADRVASDFADQTVDSGIALTLATYLPAIGFKMSRESGSRLADVVVPESASLSYGRSLSREDSTVIDSTVWTTTMKTQAVNVFGSMGSHPIGLPFDSDEYLSTFQADLTIPRDGSSMSCNLLYHDLSTFYSGATQDNKLDAETKASVTALPSSLAWSGSLSLSLSRRVERHWLLSIYNSILKPSLSSAPAGMANDAASGAASDSASDSAPKKEASVTSYYLEDLRSRETIMRSTWTLTGGLSGMRTDADGYQPGWSFDEGYEAKLTVPERLTIKMNTDLTQALDDSTKIYTMGLVVSLNAVVSF